MPPEPSPSTTAAHCAAGEVPQRDSDGLVGARADLAPQRAMAGMPTHNEPLEIAAQESDVASNPHMREMTGPFISYRAH